MKIIYLHQYFKIPQESGGTRSYDLAKRFVEAGHEVFMYTIRSKNLNRKLWQTEIIDGIEVNYFQLKYSSNFGTFRRVLSFIKFMLFVTLKIIKKDADIIIASSTPLTIGVPALLKKFYTHTPYIFEVRDVWPEAVLAIGEIKNKIIISFLNFLEGLIYRNAEFIIPLSVDMKSSIIKRYPKLDSNRIIVIENISELNRFSTKTTEQSILKRNIGFIPRFSVLYAGAFGKVNGLGFVVKFAYELKKKDPSIVFILVGEGREFEFVKTLSNDLNVLNQNVFFLDSVKKDELPQLYQECSLGSSFVIPIEELWANSANKVFDTFAASKPLLINYGGWQKRLIEKNNIGFVLNSQIDSDEVLRFIEYSYKGDLLIEQGINAFGLARLYYSLDIASAKYLNILREVYLDPV